MMLSSRERVPNRDEWLGKVQRITQFFGPVNKSIGEYKWPSWIRVTNKLLTRQNHIYYQEVASDTGNGKVTNKIIWTTRLNTSGKFPSQRKLVNTNVHFKIL